ncbi:MAG: 16S rRNA (uracil(1498)-N(3))-methyltransferase [Pseudomonadota bacterium]
MSATPRLFVTHDLLEGAQIPMTEEQGNYLLRVLRLGEGAALRLFNGRDGEWTAALHPEGKRAAVAVLGQQMRAQPAHVTDLELWFAPVKKARTDFIVEKATELGVHRIRPVLTGRTHSERVRIDRFEKIALEAAEQTERLDLPVIEDPLRLEDALQRIEPNRSLYFCDEAGDDGSAPWGGKAGRAPPFALALAGAAPGPAAILIGPEGGFTPDERAALRGHVQVHPVGLGPRILRAETAVVAALAVWQSQVGDWR